MQSRFFSFLGALFGAAALILSFFTAASPFVTRVTYASDPVGWGVVTLALVAIVSAGAGLWRREGVPALLGVVLAAVALLGIPVPGAMAVSLMAVAGLTLLERGRAL
ncbi:MAG: hypothetical protein ACI9MR_003116 [Myxococcota bacterium]|jgi:hypothetical protein